MFLLEEYQILDGAFLELINSLLSCGDVPELFTSEELDAFLSPLKEVALEEGFTGPISTFFASCVKRNVHVVMIMELQSSVVVQACECNPALYTKCSFQSMVQYSSGSMLSMPAAVLGEEGGAVSSIADWCFKIHQSLSLIHI